MDPNDLDDRYVIAAAILFVLILLLSKALSYQITTAGGM